jgi:hypothetical protein
MFEIKADPKVPYHYFLGVATKDIVSKDYGQLYLKYFLEYAHKDIEKVRKALRLIHETSPMLPSGITKSDAIKIAGCREVLHSIYAMKISAMSNNVILCHFSSDWKIKESFFENLVREANSNKRYRELLVESRIHL